MRSLVRVLVTAVVAVGCGAGAGSPGTVASPPAEPGATANAGDCVARAALAPVTVPPLAVVDEGHDTTRVTSAEAGYSLLVPRGWLISGAFAGSINPWFGQAHMTSYDPRTVPSSRPEGGGILPPGVGIRFDIEMWANPFGEAPDAYARRVHIGPDQIAVLPGAFVTLGGVTAYRFTIQDERRFQPQSGPFIATRQTREVWLVPSPRADRMLVFYATPGESALLSLVERAMSTLRVTAPAPAVAPVIHQRSEILQRWLVGKAGPIAGRRAEAKLMTYARARAAFDPAPAPGGILRIDRDPEELVWIVAVSGPDLPQGRGSRAATPPPTAWIEYLTPATNDRSEGMGQAFASTGTWPAGFDALPDRCH